eukprot:2572563-Pleurochrysis_carterae.AAC.1
MAYSAINASQKTNTAIFASRDLTSFNRGRYPPLGEPRRQVDLPRVWPTWQLVPPTDFMLNFTPTMVPLIFHIVPHKESQVTKFKQQKPTIAARKVASLPAADAGVWNSPKKSQRYFEPESLVADSVCSTASTFSDDVAGSSAEVSVLAPESADAESLEEAGVCNHPHRRILGGHALWLKDMQALKDAL